MSGAYEVQPHNENLDALADSGTTGTGAFVRQVNPTVRSITVDGPMHGVWNVSQHPTLPNAFVLSSTSGAQIVFLENQILIPNLRFIGLPTSNPGSGLVWNDGGFLKVGT
jgi:hypothetical protein